MCPNRLEGMFDDDEPVANHPLVEHFLKEHEDNKFTNINEEVGAIEGNSLTFACNDVSGGVGVIAEDGDSKVFKIPALFLMFTDTAGIASPVVTLSTGAMMMLFPMIAHAGDVVLELLSLLEKEHDSQTETEKVREIIQERLADLNRKMPPKEYAANLYARMVESRSK